jgi:hypothetical protein
VTKEDVAKAAREMQDIAKKMEAEHRLQPGLSAIAYRFGLTSFERSVLLLCVAMALDTSIADL